MYEIIYPMVFFLVTFMNPFAIFFYDSDSNDTLCSRILWSLLYGGIVCAIWSAFTFISYFFLGAYTINGMDDRINISIYIMLVLSLVGWLFLALNGGIGLIFLPFDLLAYFINQPEPLTTEQAHGKRVALQNESGTLITEGEQLKVKAEELGQLTGGWFSRKRAQN